MYEIYTSKWNHMIIEKGQRTLENIDMLSKICRLADRQA